MLRTFVVLALVACKGEEPEPPPSLAWSVDGLAFGDVPEGAFLEQIVTFTNEGGGDIQMLSAVIAEGDPDIWQVRWERGRSLSAGASLDLTVTFRPDAPDERFGGLLHVRTSDEPGVRIALEGFGSASIADDDGDGVSIADGDCDDGDASVFPGAIERCNGRDDDCDGAPGPDEADEDFDGARVCDADCDDTDGARSPLFPEICDGIDNDCDGVVEDDLDEDGDGLSICQDDCDDANPYAAPDQVEVCGDTWDNDCDGVVDSLDADLDGHDACGEAPDCDDSDAAVFPRVVSPTGDDAAGGTWALPLATIQTASDSLVPECPYVYLQPGDHAGAVLGGPVTLVGRGATLQDVRIVGPGRLLETTADLTIRNVALVDGAIDGPGAAVSSAGGVLVLQDVEVSGNSSSSGAVHAAGGRVVLAGDTTFIGNTATADGGAIALVDAQLFGFGASSFVGNTAAGDGGAVHAGPGVVDLVGDVFVDNTAGGSGGALALDGSGNTVEGAWFENNSALDGGAIAFAAGQGLLRNGVFFGNGATGVGGAVRIVDGSFDVLNNTFVANSATTGAAMATSSEVGLVWSNLAHFNTGDGAFHADGASVASGWNTAFGTAGQDYVGPWNEGVDNRSENPGFIAFSNDGDPSNDDFGLQPSSPSRDTGPLDPGLSDPDGTTNDRGATGGPGAY